MADSLSIRDRARRRFPGSVGTAVSLALLYGGLLVVLIVASSPRQSGDAAEYLAMSNNLRQF